MSQARYAQNYTVLAGRVFIVTDVRIESIANAANASFRASIRANGVS